MEILVTGCERSGTKLLSKNLGRELGVKFQLENKHTIASYKYSQELTRWEKYKNAPSLVNNIYGFEKHSLNREININFLKWVKQTWSNIKIYYIIRDGRNVVSSIINRTWGISQTQPNYIINLQQACEQWNEVIENTWEWAQKNCIIVRYEDICGVVSTPLNDQELPEVVDAIGKNLIKTGYKL